MSIVVLTPASSTNFCVIDEVQNQLGVSSGTDDEIFDKLIDAASGFIREYTNRKYAREELEELLPGEDEVELMLSRTPIESVTSVSLNGSVITDFTIEDPEAGILFRENGWLGSYSYRPGVARHPIAGSSLPRYKIAYWAGYKLPGQVSGTFALPAVLQQVCMDIVRVWYIEIKDNVAGNATQVKTGDYTITYGKDGYKGVPASILLRLRSWRGVV